ncbi:MAG TPA: prepilin-type N-terminal cleavage/methylation domain-containing protein [Phycisphaerales bacterium]|nr:prepilin-type N-terminal cleavage/methylation domain-containing protein [Phycisphaerales bacterium]
MRFSIGGAWRGGRRAFTLVEILVVVVILGILGAIVVPQFAGAAEESRRTAFVSELRVWLEAVELHVVREGSYPADGSSGECPPGFEPYIDEEDFERGTPVGGVWDVEFDEWGITSAVGVHFWGGGPVQDDAYMTLVDEIYDDGDLATGMFRRLDAGRYYAVVED